ncbi:MAG: hypothetical protein JNL73_23745 [Anaerolineales bacterium]|nr:hypothetical protein [Anaerolineales bacterium]
MSSPRRHPLLINRQRILSWRWPAFLIALGAGALAGFGERIVLPGNWWVPPVIWAGLALLAGFGFIATFLLPSMCYIEAEAKTLTVSVPFYRLAIGYPRIISVRTGSFEPPTDGGLRADLAARFRGMPVVIVELKGLPLPRAWLRWVLDWHAFPATGDGLQFLVADWMALNRQIEASREAYSARRRSSGQTLSLAQEITGPRKRTLFRD